jgi:hypothetical protein
MIKVEFSASYSLSQFTYHSYCPEYIYCHFTVKRPNKLLKHNSFPFLPCPTNKKKKKNTTGLIFILLFHVMFWLFSRKF